MSNDNVPAASQLQIAAVQLSSLVLHGINDFAILYVPWVNTMVLDSTVLYNGG